MMAGRKRPAGRESNPGRRIERRDRVQKKSFQQQEENTADALPQGQMTRGSGCAWKPSGKSDAHGHLFRAECKTVDDPAAKSFRVLRKDLAKITSEARQTGCAPVYVFGWPSDPREDWAAFQLRDAETMMRAISALRNGDFKEAQSYAELIGL